MGAIVFTRKWDSQLRASRMRSEKMRDALPARRASCDGYTGLQLEVIEHCEATRARASKKHASSEAGS
jgi:hypothetical protein